MSMIGSRRLKFVILQPQLGVFIKVASMKSQQELTVPLLELGPEAFCQTQIASSSPTDHFPHNLIFNMEVISSFFYLRVEKYV